MLRLIGLFVVVRWVARFALRAAVVTVAVALMGLSGVSMLDLVSDRDGAAGQVDPVGRVERAVSGVTRDVRRYVHREVRAYRRADR
jgi:hypothetical protein